MKKALILVIVALLAIGVTGALFAVAFFGYIQLGEPKLKVEFDPNPPWHMESGGTLELNMRIVNSAWLFATAKHVQIVVLAPEDFFVNGTDTDEYNMHFDMFRGGEERNNRLTLTVPHTISSGNYNMTIRVLAENVPEQILTAQIIVAQPIFIP